MNAAYVLEEIGTSARAFSSILAQTLSKEPDKLVRIYQLNALRALADNQPQILEVVKSRFAEVNDNDERLYAAAALFILSTNASEKESAERLFGSYLRRPQKEMDENFWDIRWSAVNASQHMLGSTTLLPLLEQMLDERPTKPWVADHVRRAISALQYATTLSAQD